LQKICRQDPTAADKEHKPLQLLCRFLEKVAVLLGYLLVILRPLRFTDRMALCDTVCSTLRLIFMLETGTDSYKLARFEQKALAYGYSGLKLRFSSLDTQHQSFLLGQTKLEKSELPALGFFEHEETWLVATTRKLVWSRPGFRYEMSYFQIKNDGLTEMERIQSSTEFIEDRLEKVREIKANSRQFFWEDEQGKRYESLLPPGETLFSIWNLIRFLVRLDEIHPIRKG